MRISRMWYQLIGVVLTVLSELSGPGFPVQSSADVYSCGVHSLICKLMGSHMCMLTHCVLHPPRGTPVTYSLYKLACDRSGLPLNHVPVRCASGMEPPASWVGTNKVRYRTGHANCTCGLCLSSLVSSFHQRAP